MAFGGQRFSMSLIPFMSPLLPSNTNLDSLSNSNIISARKTFGILALLTPPGSYALHSPYHIGFMICHVQILPSLTRTGLSLPAGRCVGSPSTLVSLALARSSLSLIPSQAGFRPSHVLATWAICTHSIANLTPLYPPLPVHLSFGRYCSVPSPQHWALPLKRSRDLVSATSTQKGNRLSERKRCKWLTLEL